MTLAVYTTIYSGVEPYLSDWFRSLRQQTDREFELWVGLDGLTIESLERFWELIWTQPGLWLPQERPSRDPRPGSYPASLRDVREWCWWTATIACIRAGSKPRERVSRALNLPDVRCASLVSRENLWAATSLCRRTFVPMRCSRATMFSGSRIPRFDRSCWPSACRYPVKLFWWIGCLRQGRGCSGQDSALILFPEWTTVNMPPIPHGCNIPFERSRWFPILFLFSNTFV